MRRLEVQLLSPAPSHAAIAQRTERLASNQEVAGRVLLGSPCLVGLPSRPRKASRLAPLATNGSESGWARSLQLQLDRNHFERSLVLAVQRQPGANTVAVSDSIKKILPQLKSYLPPSVELRMLYDRAVTIRTAVRDLNGGSIGSLEVAIKANPASTPADR